MLGVKWLRNHLSVECQFWCHMSMGHAPFGRVRVTVHMISSFKWVTVFFEQYASRWYSASLYIHSLIAWLDLCQEKPNMWLEVRSLDICCRSGRHHPLHICCSVGNLLPARWHQQFTIGHDCQQHTFVSGYEALGHSAGSGLPLASFILLWIVSVYRQTAYGKW